MDSMTATLPAADATTDPGLQSGLGVVSIAKSYDKRAVLTDVSLSVAKGEVVGLLGPNGAGKTTCFYSIMGLVKPDSGRITLDGADITNLPMYRRAILGLGYLPQETSIFRGMTVEQNISAVLEMSEPDADSRSERLEKLLDEFGLTVCGVRLPWPCRAVNGDAARLHVRWLQTRRSCFLTNPLPALTQFQFPTSAIW